MWYAGFKAAVFALLACNAAIYLFRGTVSQALDAMAWLTLLVLFALETGFGGQFRDGRAAAAVRIARLIAAIAVGAAVMGYSYENKWLDTVNTALWIMVVVLLELEVRLPGAVARRRAWFVATAAILYSGLAALVLVWAWRSEWFDAYDALLWLAAFATIEMDVLRTSRQKISA